MVTRAQKTFITFGVRPLDLELFGSTVVWIYNIRKNSFRPQGYSMGDYSLTREHPLNT